MADIAGSLVLWTLDLNSISVCMKEQWKYDYTKYIFIIKPINIIPMLVSEIHLL